MSDHKIAKPKSLTTLAMEKIREGIRSGHYPLGAPLYEKVLADEFGISKTPVREALVQLQHDGLVVVIPHTGTFVFTLGDSELRDLCELRLILETNSLQLAMQRAPAALSAELDRIVQTMSEVVERGETEGYGDLDTAFHNALFAHSGNGYLLRCYEVIEAKIATLRATLINPLPELIALSVEEHRKIAAALAAADTNGALAILTAHVRRARDVMQRLNDIPPVDVTEV